MTRDRETKPVKYARAKIPHYWRVEDVDGRAVVYVFELEPATGAYTSTGIFHDRMKVSVPFPVDLDLARIKPAETGPQKSSRSVSRRKPGTSPRRRAVRHPMHTPARIDHDLWSSLVAAPKPPYGSAAHIVLPFGSVSYRHMRKLLAVGFMAITLTLTVAGCSKQPANRPADAAAASKETAETGPRPLAQAELAASRLTEQETATLKYVSMWTDNTLEAFADIKRVSATPAPCQPVADAIYRGYPDGSTAYADVSYSEKDSALVAGYISLSSDSAAGAEKFFDAVRSSLEQCDQFTHTGRYGDTITTMITMGPIETP